MVSQPFEFVKQQMVKFFVIIELNERVHVFWTGCWDSTDIVHVCTPEWKSAQPARGTGYQMERCELIFRSFRYGESVKFMSNIF